MAYIGNTTKSSPFITDSYTGTGSQTAFLNMTYAPASYSSIAVHVDGVYKTPGTDYTTSGKTLNFATAPSNGAKIVVLHLAVGQTTTTVVADGAITAAKIANNTITVEKLSLSSNVIGLTLPQGNTASKPVAAAEGTIRFNTSNNNIELYANAAWVVVGSAPAPVLTSIEGEIISGNTNSVINIIGENFDVDQVLAQGTLEFNYDGTIAYVDVTPNSSILISGVTVPADIVAKSPSTSGTIRFTRTDGRSSGTVTKVMSNLIGVYYLVIAGGGGGGQYSGSAYVKGNKGSNSVFHTVTSIGGGGGGASTNFNIPDVGGSGGGGSGYSPSGGDSLYGAAGTTGQGYAGGNQYNVPIVSGSVYSGGGGGGAGAAGQNGQSGNVCGAGGQGVWSDITGTGTQRGGGGGSGGAGSFTAGAGGAGGGGNGRINGKGYDGTVNTGGGGGAGDSGIGAVHGGGGAGGYRTSWTSASGVSSPKLSGGGGAIESPLFVNTGTNYTVTVGAGAAAVASYDGLGGSGIVILRYPSSLTLTNPGGGLTTSTSTISTQKVTTITAGTGNIQLN